MLLNIIKYFGVVMKKLIYNLILPCTFIAILLWSVIGVSQDRHFYDIQYQQNKTADHIGIRHQDLMSVTDNLLSYMVKQRPDLEMQFGVKGEIREIFDEREKLHMIDVVNLYMGVVYIGIALSAFVAVSVVALCKTDGLKTVRKTLRKKYKWSAIGILLVAGSFGIVIATNFQWFWTNFHYVFFTNDLWMLDPRVSIMINMFPLNFFFAMCRQILICFVIWCAAVRLVLADFGNRPKWLRSKREYGDVI